MSRFLDGNSIQLLERGIEYFPVLIDAIEYAEQEIFFETYIFEDDATGRAVAAALAAAARRGVRVHLLVDGFGARRFVRDTMPTLRVQGVQVMIYRREFATFSLRRQRLRRLHRKLVVIDGTVGFVGGINIIDDVTAGGPPVPRLDYAVRIEGPLLGPLLQAADRLWRLVAWAGLHPGRRDPLLANARIRPAGDLRAAFLIRDNLANRRQIEDAYLDAIAGARREIWIACAYFLPGRRFRQALIDAAARGVRVNLLLQGLVDYRLLFHATRALYPHLLSAGVKLFEYHRSYLHAKVAVIDDSWATVGSSNIDPFSLLLAREANVVVLDPGFALELRTRLQLAVRDGGHELRPEYWRRLPWLRRIGAWLAFQTVRMAIGIAGAGNGH